MREGEGRRGKKNREEGAKKEREAVDGCKEARERVRVVPATTVWLPNLSGLVFGTFTVIVRLTLRDA